MPLAPAEEMLQVMRQQQQAQARSVGSGPAAGRIDFDKLSEAERQRLYQEFQQWQKNPKR